MKVIRTERGWGGHFICANLCLFRRNTLLEYKEKKIVVSTVGNMYLQNKLETIGANGRLYETMAFHSNNDNYKDIDVNREIEFKSNWALTNQNDIEANLMHERVVNEITKMIKEEC